MLEIINGDVIECLGPLVIPLITAAATVAKAGIDAYSSSKASYSNKKINEKSLAQEKWIAEQNFARQDQAYEYQKWLNDQTMSREDDAVRRRVADLKAAGLNPVLAAGDAASSAGFRAGSAPQMDSSYIGQYAQRAIETNNIEFQNQMAVNKLMLDFASQAVDISRTKAETAVLNERAESMKQERPLNVENMTLANAFLKQSFDVRLEQKYADLSATQKENLIRDKKAVLLDKQVDYEDVKYLMGYADYLLKGKTMDKYDKELLVMDSLIRARDMEYDINKWNLDYFKGRGLPTSYRDPTEIKLFNEVLGGFPDVLGSFFDKIFDDLPQDVRDNIKKNLDAYKAKTGKDFHNFAPTKNNMKYLGKSGYQS